jgi:hypothetical protein
VTTVDPPSVSVAAAAAEGRSPFVAEVLNDYTERTGRSVPDAIEEFILQNVLVPDSDWDREPFDPEQVARILRESIDEIYRGPKAEPIIEMSYVRSAFEGVIDDRWRCPFPFIFC